jgi:hypothetical protein
MERRPPDFITVVSGVPRSGTSLMMSMLVAGGLEPLKDDVRAPDEDNPRGYFELELVKGLKQDASWVDRAVGRVVKVVHVHLKDLPRGRHRYRVVLMRRDMAEVVRSQKKMLERRGKGGGKLGDARAAELLALQVEELRRWMDAEPSFSHLVADYNDLLRDPRPGVRAVVAFLGGGLDEEAMVRQVDPRLYRST